MGKTRKIAGWSESLWKSLAVKSLRMGWPAGLKEARRQLNKSTVKTQLICGAFEDILPATDEIHEVLEAVEEHDYERLCAWETHHSRRYTEAFCNLEEEAMAAARNRRREMFPRVRELDIWLPPRAFNVFYTWLKLQPKQGGRREVDERPFDRMPRAMADGHTYEGKYLDQEMTVLSGHYHQHRRLGHRVQEEGWESVREEVHADLLPPPPAGQAELAL